MTTLHDQVKAEAERQLDPRLAKIGNRIAVLRKEKGWTQQDLADQIGLSRSSIANIEVGRQELSITHLWSIADALGSTVGEITATPSMPWLELARRTHTSLRSYEQLADKSWRDHDYLAAIRWRGVAEGIGIARLHHLEVVEPVGIPIEEVV